jgi:hypothetical protein
VRASLHLRALACEYRHLTGWPDLRVFVSDRKKPHVISEARSYSPGPLLELPAVPLESVIGMTEASRGQRWPLHVVFSVGRREGNDAGLRRLEHDPFERAKTRRIEVLDNFHHNCRIEAAKADVPIHKRAVQQTDALALLRRETIELESRFSLFRT